MHSCDAHQPHWKTVVAGKKAELAAKIPEEWLLSQRVIDYARSRRSIVGDFLDSLLDSHTRNITRREPTEIVRGIASGNLSSVDVVTAFCKRASYIHQIIPAFLEIEFDLALSRAKELDEYFITHGQTVGPLHGLPITLKDHFHIKGLETSFGYVGWIGTFQGIKGTGKEKNVESELIRQLVSVGAVPIAKTTLMVKLSTGGSSGGEALVQALRGSAVGFGSDSGGSVSMPSSYNGICSVKPSPGRLSCEDAAGSGLGNLAITAVVGIMGPSIGALRLVFKSLMETRPWEHDPFVLPIPWRSDREVSPDAGFKPGKFDYSAYTSIVNILGYSSAVVQVTFGDKNIDVVEDDYKPLGQRDRLNMDTYDAHASDGVSAAIQMLGRELEEEKILSIAQIVAGAIKDHQAKQV
ncbi:hypothetical protein MY1884_005319 [Beauveria asiatica]